MINIFFGDKKFPSNKWMVRVMNFGQKPFGDMPSMRYEMVLEKSVINEITRSDFCDIKEDAKDFPHDWGTLGAILLQQDHPSYIQIESEDQAVAKEYLLDFGYDILIELEKKYHDYPDNGIDYVINSVEDIKIGEEQITFCGQAFEHHIPRSMLGSFRKTGKFNGD